MVFECIGKKKCEILMFSCKPNSSSFSPFKQCTLFKFKFFSKYDRFYSAVAEVANESTLSKFMRKLKLQSVEKALHYSDLKKSQQKSMNLIENDMKYVIPNIKRLISSNVNLLPEISQYYFNLDGKRLRPAIVLLMSHAVDSHYQQINAINQLNELNGKESPNEIEHNKTVLPNQLQLAEIVEMIHTASIVHDDVIDDATTRRGEISVNIKYNNRNSIYSGDFLLSKASIALSRLHNHRVVEIMSNVISDLVEGEFLQISNNNYKSNMPPQSSPNRAIDFNFYMDKTYYKTASLIANGCECAAILNPNSDENLIQTTFNYGKHLGLAFQLIDDLLDFTGNVEELGKQPFVDIQLGLITAPILFAMECNSQLIELVQRKFTVKGDQELAIQIVKQSDGLERTKILAKSHCDKAIAAISTLLPSPARTILIDICEKIINRRK